MFSSAVEDRQQVVALEDEADLAAAQQREVAVVERVEARAGDLDPALGRPVEARRGCACSVDLPEPDGPMIAVKVPRRERDVDAAQRVDGGSSPAEALDEAVAADDLSTAGSAPMARGWSVSASS